MNGLVCPMCGKSDMQGIAWKSWFGSIQGIFVCRRCHISTYPGSFSIQALRWDAGKYDIRFVERYSNNAWRKLMRQHEVNSKKVMRMLLR